MSEPTYEYRATCPLYGTQGHTAHQHTLPTLDKAIERAEGNDSLYGKLSKWGRNHYSKEVGWTVQVRTVTEWEDVT